MPPVPSSKATAAADRAWLAGDPPASEIRERFPAEWATVQRELAAVVDAGDVEAIKRYAARVASGGGGGAVRNDREAVRVMARQRLAADALRQMGVAAATGVTGGRLRFGLVSGWITQRLLFAGGGLERKPVSMRAFRLLWPLVRNKSYLMPLVEPRGIYCFYSRELVRGLRELIGDRGAVRGDRRGRRDAVAVPARGGRRRRRDRRLLVAEDAARAGRRRRRAGRGGRAARAGAAGGAVLLAAGGEPVRGRGVPDRERRVVRGGRVAVGVRGGRLGRRTARRPRPAAYAGGGRGAERAGPAAADRERGLGIPSRK